MSLWSPLRPAGKHPAPLEIASAASYGQSGGKRKSMSRLHTRLGTWTITLCMFFVLTGISALAKPQAASPDDQTATTTTKKKKKKAKTDASATADPTAAASDTPYHAKKKSRRARKPSATDSASAASTDATPAKKTRKRQESCSSCRHTCRRHFLHGRAPPPAKKTRKSKKAAADQRQQHSGRGSRPAALLPLPADATPLMTKKTRKSKKSEMASSAGTAPAASPAPATTPRLRRRPQQLRPVPWLPLRIQWRPPRPRRPQDGHQPALPIRRSRQPSRAAWSGSTPIAASTTKVAAGTARPKPENS